ncbi:MAG: hypothetical protein O7G88_13300 [bacterium]|nr:hypothetical protein [bacterium]
MESPLERFVQTCTTYQCETALAYINTPPGETRTAGLADAVRHAVEVCSISELQMLETHIAEASVASQPVLRRLQAWGRTMYLRGVMLPHRTEMQALQRSAICIVDEEPIPLLSSFAAMAMETRRDRRASIEASVSEQLDDINGLFDTQFKALCQAAEEAGYTSVEKMWADILPGDLAAQHEQAVCLLKETEDVYTDLLTWAVKQRLRIPPGQLRRHDILALFTFPDYQTYYQPGALIDCLPVCLQEMDIDPYADGRLALRQRPATFGFPVAVAVQIPDQVVLSYSQVAGPKASEAYASAFGRALLWAYTSSALPLTVRQLGDPAVPISSAQLFAEMVTAPSWLRHYLRVTVDRHYWLWHRLDRLYRFRRQLGRFLFAYQLSSMDSLAGAQDMYREIMMTACQVDYTSAYCLVDWDWSFTSLAMLRGWSLSYLLLETVRSQFGDDWFRNTDSGVWLRDYWATAVGGEVEELYQQFSYIDWTPELLAEALGREEIC